jgi:hypothetical protein
MKNLVNRTGGKWYSTFDIGDCDNAAATSCEWRLVETVKRVNATCHGTTMERDLIAQNSGCFAKCNHPLNTTDMCYLSCFYNTLLGPDAGTTYPSTGGLSGDAVVKLWTGAFDKCPGM